MAFSPHSKEIQKWFASIFGLSTTLKDCIEITFTDEEKLIRYILESYVGKECDRNSISELKQIELERSFLTIQYPDKLNKVLHISLLSLFSLSGDIKNGWINDEIFDLWRDSVNLLNGIEGVVSKVFSTEFSSELS